MEAYITLGDHKGSTAELCVDKPDLGGVVSTLMDMAQELGWEVLALRTEQPQKG